MKVPDRQKLVAAVFFMIDAIMSPARHQQTDENGSIV